MLRSRLLSLLAVLTLVSACGSERDGGESTSSAGESAAENGEATAAETVETLGTPAEREPDVAPTAELPLPGPESGLGVVVGRVRLAAGAELPSYDNEALFGDSQEGNQGESCPPPRRSDRQPTPMAPDRGLAGLMISATGDQATFFAHLPSDEGRESVEHLLRIRDCRLEPRLVSAQVGDTLTIVNESAEPFLPSMSNSGFMQAVMAGERRSEPLERGGVGAMRCPFSLPCGRADIVVIHHPVHTVSGEGGAFELRNVPADQEVVLHAWHPLFEEATVRVSVPAGGRREVEILISPAEVLTPTPPAATPETTDDATEQDSTDDDARLAPEPASPGPH